MAIFLRESRELFIGESVWWFLVEGDELGNLYKSLHVERSSYAYHNWDYFDVGI
jgi:hypothetical protein